MSDTEGHIPPVSNSAVPDGALAASRGAAARAV